MNIQFEDPEKLINYQMLLLIPLCIMVIMQMLVHSTLNWFNFDHLQITKDVVVDDETAQYNNGLFEDILAGITQLFVASYIMVLISFYLYHVMVKNSLWSSYPFTAINLFDTVVELGRCFNLSLLIFMSMIVSSNSYEYNNWSPGSQPLPRAAVGSAVGYSSATNTIWILSGSGLGGGSTPVNPQQLVSFNATAQTFVDHGEYGLPSTFVPTFAFPSQYYTKINEYLYVNTYGRAPINKFNVNTGSTETFTGNQPYSGSGICLTSIDLDGGYLFAMGGWYSTALSSFQIFNITTNQWIQGPSLNIGRTQAACIANNNQHKLYAIGGTGSGNQILNSVEMLDITNLQSITSWISLSDTLSTSMTKARAISYEHNVLTIGGVADSEGIDPISVMNVINAVTNAITTSGSLATKMSQTATIVVNNNNNDTAYTFGGLAFNVPGQYGVYLTTWEYLQLPPRTSFPSQSPTTPFPTPSPTALPTDIPTASPTNITTTPTSTPSAVSTAPTLSPTQNPTMGPSAVPTYITSNPTSITSAPSTSPTNITSNPTLTPSVPTSAPSLPPTTYGTYGTWIEGSTILPRAVSSSAVGYSSTKNLIWILGPSKGLISFDVTNQMFHDNGTNSLSPCIIQTTTADYTQINEYLYIIYLYNRYSQDGNSTIQRFNVETGSCELFEPDPKFRREEACLASVETNGGYLFVVGGSLSLTPKTSVIIFNITGNKWIDAPSMNIGRYQLGCISDIKQTRLYAIGGLVLTGGTAHTGNSVEMLDVNNLQNLQNNQWILLNDTLSTGIRSMQIILYGSNIIVVGGFGSGSDVPVPQTEIIDTTTNTIRISGYFAKNVIYISAIIVADTAYAFGGVNNTVSWQTMNTWRYLDLPETYAPTATPTASPTPSPTALPSGAPTSPTISPTIPPTSDPTSVPTMPPTVYGTYGIWKQGLTSLGGAIMGSAVGYSSVTDTIWILGNELYVNYKRQLISFNVANNSIINHGNVLSNDVTGYSQYYTQINEYLYTLNPTNNGINRFNVDEGSFDSFAATIPVTNQMRIVYEKYAALASVDIDGGYIFAIGGFNSITKDCLGYVWVLNVSNNEWISAPSLNVARVIMSSITTNDKDKLYVIGGQSGVLSGPLNSVEVLDIGDLQNINDEQWILLDDTLTTSMSALRVILHGNDIVTIGGWNNPFATPIAGMNIIDTTTNTIRASGSLDIAMYYTSSVVVNEVAYTFGGIDYYGYLNTWRYLELPPYTPSPITSEISESEDLDDNESIASYISFKNAEINILFALIFFVFV